MKSAATLSTREALEQCLSSLDAVDHAARDAASHAERLTCVELANVLARRSAALLAVLVSEADAAESAIALRGTPTTSWLALDGTTTAREAAGLVFAGRDITRHVRVRDAALSGQLSMSQARTIDKAMAEVPDDLSSAERATVEDDLVAHAATIDPRRLTGAVNDSLARVVPSHAIPVESDLQRLDAQKKRARAKRSLTFVGDGDGSVLIRGCLPVLEARPLIAMIDAQTESTRRAEREAIHRLDPLDDTPSPAQRRADALIALAETWLQSGASTRVAGARPRVVVVMNESDLRTRAEQAGRLSTGETISAGDLRRLCCDAELAPIVLGGSSEVLDVGRTQRLVTPAIRRALSVRDGGCVFPGCAMPDHRCDAHHVVPWWAGGATCLDNLALLCPHHHALVEPARFFSGAPPDRWEVRIGGDGVPEVIPPRRVDSQRRPRRRRPPDAA